MSEPDASGRLPLYVRRVLIALGLAAAFVVSLFVIWRIGEALLIVFASCLFAIFLSSCTSWLSDKFSLAHGVSMSIVVLFLVALVTAASTLLGVQLAQQATQLFQGLQDSVQQAREWAAKSEWGEQFVEQLDGDEVQIGALAAPATRVLRAVGGGVTLAVLVVVIGLYLAGKPALYKRGFLRLVPISKRPRTSELIDAVGTALRGWLWAQFISMAVIGTLVAIGLWLFNIELWLILGLLAGALTFIPNLGPIIAGIPPVVLALNQSVWLAMGVLAYFTAVQMLEGYLVTPLVQDHVIHMPPAAILSIQLIMAYAFGLLGVAVAAPMLAALMVIIEMVYVQDLLGDRNIQVTGQ